MEYSRGSEWRRWDLHVHTPCSIINANFGDNFDEYVKQLFTRAIENKIACIGVTDYFSIEGYKKIRDEYLSCESKMIELFPDESVRIEISKILLLPNVELRLDCFVGDNQHAVNYHVIFSDQISTDLIEQKFFGALRVPKQYAGGAMQQKEPITKEGIIRVGQHNREYLHETGEDYKIGLRHITVSLSDITYILRSDNTFKDKALLFVPSDEDLSRISWEGRNSTTRRLLIQTSDAIFASNPQTVKWALGELDGEGGYQRHVNEFLKIRPTFSGSDAHEFDSMFNNAHRRYCWIKADPTFNGLRQTLFEPKERVRINETQPETKYPYYVINSVKLVICPQFMVQEQC